MLLKAIVGGQHLRIIINIPSYGHAPHTTSVIGEPSCVWPLFGITFAQFWITTVTKSCADDCLHFSIVFLFMFCFFLLLFFLLSLCIFYSDMCAIVCEFIWIRLNNGERVGLVTIFPIYSVASFCSAVEWGIQPRWCNKAFVWGLCVRTRKCNYCNFYP